MATIGKVLDIARGELGNKESPPNSNECKYNDWYYGRRVSGSSYPWCMTFLQWVFNQAGMPLPYLTASCSGLLTWYQRNRPDAIKKTPNLADIVIYNFGHTGVVEKVNDSNIVAIEGNTSPTAGGSQSNGGMVCRKTRGFKTVTAYIRPDYDKEDDMDFSKWTDADFVKFAARMQDALAKQQISAALAPELSEAVKKGITDGKSPMAFATRAQSAVMTLRNSK